MGNIVLWTLIRLVILIPALWYYSENYSGRFDWAVLSISIYLIIIHPIISAYKIFEENNKKVIEESLCSKCKHFDESAVLCMKFDEHPKENYIPCGTEHFEKK